MNAPKKFRKKPVEIEAMQWDGTRPSANAIIEWAQECRQVVHVRTDHALYVATFEGEMTVSHGDYVIRGVAGELYPCKPDIFAATYEAVE